MRLSAHNEGYKIVSTTEGRHHSLTLAVRRGRLKIKSELGVRSSELGKSKANLHAPFGAQRRMKIVSTTEGRYHRLRSAVRRGRLTAQLFLSTFDLQTFKT